MGHGPSAATFGRVLAPVLLSGIGVLAPSAVRAQGATCSLEASKSVTQGNIMFISGPLAVRCTDGVTVRADSAVNLTEQKEWYLIGHVTYADTAKRMKADWVHYQSQQRYLQGRGSVRVEDQKSRSVITGEGLQYFREAPSMGREESRLVVDGGSPHAELYPRDTASAAPPDSVKPTIVDARVIQITGENSFQGTGDVHVIRGEIDGTGDQADYDEATRRLRLTGHATVTGETFDLTANAVDAFLDASNRIERVIALGNAVLTSDQAKLTAPEVRIAFEDGQAHRLIALGARRAAKEAAPSDSTLQAVAHSEGMRVVADSIDALSGGEAVDSIYAVGRAYGQQLADTVRAGLPDVVDTDWARGDTIRAYFAQLPDSLVKPTGPAATSRDSAAARTQLERLVIVGASDSEPAQSVYRSRDRNAGPATKPDINYLVARTITLRLSEGDVRIVEASGSVHGVHLTPTGRTAPADTTVSPPRSGSRP